MSRAQVGGWDGAVAAWRAALVASGKRPGTVAEYVRAVELLAAACPGQGPWEVSAALVRAWWTGARLAPSTRRRAAVAVRGFYGWAVGEGYVLRSPAVGLATSSRVERRSGPERDVLPVRWREPVAEWLAWLEAGGRSPGTVAQRRWHVGRLAAVVADPWAARPGDLALWLARPDWSPETKRAARASVRGFYGWAVVAGYLAASPAEALPAVRRHRAVPRPAPSSAVAAGLEDAPDRARVAILLGALAGLRRAEIAAVHTGDVVGDALRVRGKGGHERWVPLHPDLRAALVGWETRHGPGFVFASPEGGHLTPEHLGRIVARQLPAGVTCHQLRHRFATQAYAATRDLRAVQDLLGHAAPETTARYAAVPDGAARAAVAGVSLG